MCQGKREKQQAAKEWKQGMGAKLLQEIEGCSTVCLKDMRAVGRVWLDYREAGGDNITTQMGQGGQKPGVNGDISVYSEKRVDLRLEEKRLFANNATSFSTCKGFCLLVNRV